MRILELSAENVKRISAVTITPEGSSVIIGGANGAGKSSVLDAIFWALGGASGIPSKPVRQGQESASIRLTLSGTPNLVVTRRVTENGRTSLEVKQVAEDGLELKVASPQKLLDSLFSAVAFDPLAFTRLRPQDQVETLRKALGVSVEDLDDEAAKLFERRAHVTREGKTLAARLTSMPMHLGAPTEEVSVEDLTAKLREAQNTNAARRDAIIVAREASQESLRLGKAAGLADLEVERLVYAVAEAETAAKNASDLYEQAKEHAARLATAAQEMPEIECDEILEAIDEAGKTNDLVRANAARSEVARQVAAHRKEVAELGASLDKVRKDRVERLAAAEWPVDGLSFGSGGVTLNDLPFEQCSSAEQLRISTAIGFAQNPKLRVLLIRDGSLLDDESLADVARLAEAYDGQVWIERVGRGSECSVIIDDGHVLEVNPAGEAD